METRNIVLVVLSIFVVGLVVTSIHQDRRITNLERQAMRIETDYNRVVREADQLKRINETNLHLMAQGGWDGINTVYSIGTDN